MPTDSVEQREQRDRERRDPPPPPPRPASRVGEAAGSSRVGGNASLIDGELEGKEERGRAWPGRPGSTAHDIHAAETSPPLRRTRMREV